jgi:hypothetical protein
MKFVLLTGVLVLALLGALAELTRGRRPVLLTAPA